MNVMELIFSDKRDSMSSSIPEGMARHRQSQVRPVGSLSEVLMITTLSYVLKFSPW